MGLYQGFACRALQYSTAQVVSGRCWSQSDRGSPTLLNRWEVRSGWVHWRGWLGAVLWVAVLSAPGVPAFAQTDPLADPRYTDMAYSDSPYDAPSPGSDGREPDSGSPYDGEADSGSPYEPLPLNLPATEAGWRPMPRDATPERSPQTRRVPRDQRKRPRAGGKPGKPKARAPRPARPLPVSEGTRPVQLGATLAYGSGASKPALGANPYNVGFGIHGGYTWPAGLFLGLTSTYFLGATVPEGGVVGIAPAGAQVRAWVTGVEGGYDYWFEGATFMLRPSLEVGLVYGSTNKDPALSSGRTQLAPYLAPGAAFDWNFDAPYFAGADMRQIISLGDVDGSFLLKLKIGVRLQ